MSNRTLVFDFTQGSISKQLVRFTTPLFLSSLMQVVYNAVDMIVVGHELGENGLSAVAVGGDISNFLTFFAMGFGNAGQIIISQYAGAKQREKLGRFIPTMFTSLLLSALCMSAVCLLLRDFLLELMNTPPAAYDGALAYSTVCMSGLVFIYGYNVTSAILRGLGDSRRPFVFVTIAAVLNVVLDVAFVMGFSMGCMGAALATVVSQGVSFLLCVCFLYRSKEHLGFELKAASILKIDMGMLGQLVKLGLPMAIKSASVQFSKLFVNSWINSFGVSVSAFAGIANKLASVSNLIANSAATAGATMVGQNIGAEQFKRVPKIIGTVAAITLSIALLLSLSVLGFPRQIFGIFTTEQGVMEVAMEYLPVAVLIFFGSACRAPANSLINGSGNYKINFITAIMDGIVMRVGLSLLFGLALGLDYIGFWLGDALAGFTPPVIAVVFYLTGRWRRRAIS